MRKSHQKPFEKSELIKELSKEFERLGSTKYVTYDKRRRDHLPSGHMIRTRFGNISWAEIVELAGHKPHEKKWDKERIIKLAQSKNKKLSYKELKELGIDANVTISYFGSHKKLHEELGWEYKEKEFYHHVTNDDLLEVYKEVSEKVGYPAKITDIESLSEYPYELYRTRFGTLNEIRKRMGYDHKVDPRTITKKECMVEMLEIYDRYGRITYGELGKTLSFSTRTLLRKFGTTRIGDVWKEVISEYEEEKSQ